MPVPRAIDRSRADRGVGVSGSGPLFDAGAWSVRRLAGEHGGIIQDLAERCADYTRVVEGRPTSPTAARDFLLATPEGRGLGDVFKLGVFAAGGELVGLIEAARDYPATGDWHLGLLLLDPSARGAGLGARLYGGFEGWVAARGGRRIVLSVVEENAPALRFWRRLGFAETRILPPRRFGDKVQSRTELERRLTPDDAADSPLAPQS